jgi:pimeloyl-ACP methyl ester carboxylesterase
MNGVDQTGSNSRFSRGVRSALSCLTMPLGNLLGVSIEDLSTESRRQIGLVLILPGIEGRSSLNMNLARGLNDAGLPAAIEIEDWTTGRRWLSLYHLRSTHWHRLAAARLSQRIARYQDAYPGRPIFLIGHSGGSGVTAEALLALPAERSITGAIFLASALSAAYDLQPVLERVDTRLWAVRSWLDWLQLGIGTTLVGTFDGRHSPSAGMIGFRCLRSRSNQNPTDHSTLRADQLVEATRSRAAERYEDLPFRWTMLKSWNLGGHWGCVNRVFVADYLAPRLCHAAGWQTAALQEQP